MMQQFTSRSGRSLDDLARDLAPQLQVISSSRPTPLLRDYNVVAVARDSDTARGAVLAVEGIEHADDQLGTVVMGSTGVPDAADDGNGRVDPEGVGRQVLPRVVRGGLIGAIVGAAIAVVAGLIFGASGWELAGAAAAGAMLLSVFGAIWLTFAGFGGSDAYRQTFVDEAAIELTIVAVHTNDVDEARAAHDRLTADEALEVFLVDRDGHVVDEIPPNSNTQ